MSGNKINTKAKGKEEKTKVSKGVNQQNESEDLDYTLLRKPIPTSITGFAQARKIFDLATEELKSLLSTECDLLYECKVCRNLFRSLANFISHKRIYCKEKFNSSIHSHFTKPTSVANELVKIKHLEKEYQESLKSKDITQYDTDEVEDRIPLTKDLTAIVEKISLSKGIKDNISEEQEIYLQKIPKTSVAVFQNVHFNNETHCDIRSQVKELDDILSKNKAVLQSDGKFKIQQLTGTDTVANTDPESVIQISDDDENDDSVLKCKICDLQFSTQKTLRFHMKYKHLESRLVYPCPDCLEIFSTSWSVYRHLFKVHRKTAAQIRRLRESIQSKAFRMNNPPAFYEKRKNNVKAAPSQKITEEERLDQENQAWMDNMEGDGEIPRCGGCGRTFERRAALAAHTHTCQPRSRALARRADTKKIEIQIRKDYNKGPATALNLPIKTTDANDNKVDCEEAQHPTKTSKELHKDEDMHPEHLNGDNNDVSISNEQNNTEYKILSNLESFIPKLPFAQQAEKNNFAALKLRLQTDTDLDKLICRKCDTKHSKLQDLYDHMAGHYKWMRYACKLCNFKHYMFEKLPEHVKVVHKLKGDSDFYFSTLKAIDGTEALELCEPLDELNDVSETSPDSRRPSRCSSDSSRLSDDSSSSSIRIEIGAKKRKMNINRAFSKKKKESLVNGENENLKNNDISLDRDNTFENVKVFEENSSDIDEIDDKIVKKQILEEAKSVASRRPVRKRTRPKNEDFEYDLSNLLKKETRGYKDSQSINTKSSQSKKKIQTESQNNYEIANRDCCGALDILTKKAVENAAAHMKILSFCVNIPQKDRTPNVFVRPMLPKISRSEKISPKKDVTDDSKDFAISNQKLPEPKLSPNKDCKPDNALAEDPPKPLEEEKDKGKGEDKETLDNDKSQPKPAGATCETIKTNLNIPAVVPVKFRRQSLDVLNSPLINKNLKDLTKAGMKTKILVIKPINRNKDGTQTIKAPLKFQTIKLKDPKKANTSNEEKSSDQVVVVQVPKVECAVVCATPKLDVTTNSETIGNVDSPSKEEKSNKNDKVGNSDVEKDETTISINKFETPNANESCTTESLTQNSELPKCDMPPPVDTGISINSTT